MVQRFDIGSLRKPSLSSRGFLRGEMFATRTGVFEYPKADGGVVREYRSPEEVFHPDSLASYEDASFTDDHPPAAVTAENATKLAVGYLPNEGKRDGDHVRAHVVVEDAETIKKMQAGKQEVSCGYTCDLVWTPGVAPDGTKYDARQTNIRINHVALVDAGRAGPTARVRMDGVGIPVSDTPTRETRMDEAAKLAADKERADLAASFALAVKERDVAQARADGLATQLEQLTKRHADAADPVKFQAAVAERVSLEVVATRHGIKCDGLSARDVKSAVVEKLTARKLDAAKSDDYVSAAFDLAVEAAGAEVKAHTDSRGTAVAVTDKSMRTPEQARAEMVARNTAHNQKGAA